MSSKVFWFLLGIEIGLLLASIADRVDDAYGADLDRWFEQAALKAQTAAAQAQVWAYIASGRTLKLLQEQRAKWAGDIAERMGTHNASASDTRAEEPGSELSSGPSDVYTELGE